MESKAPLVYRDLELASRRLNGTGIATIESVDGQSRRKTECDGVLGSVHTGKKESSKFTVKLTDKACYEFEARVRVEGSRHF